MLIVTLEGFSYFNIRSTLPTVSTETDPFPALEREKVILLVLSQGRLPPSQTLSHDPYDSRPLGPQRYSYLSQRSVQECSSGTEDKNGYDPCTSLGLDRRDNLQLLEAH